VPPDDLYTRYMKAHQDNEAHKASCSECAPDAPCPAGLPAFERFARLQDAYLQRQRDHRPRQPGRP
jgi:hypothetical protein